MKPKTISNIKNVLWIVFSLVLLTSPTLAATPVYTGLHWTGYHTPGASYPIEIEVRADLYHNNPFVVEVHGLDIVEDSCQNTWGNKVMPTVSGVNVSFTMSVKVSTVWNNLYVGASRHISCQGKVTGVDPNQISKIGVYVTPGTKPATVKPLLAETGYQTMSGNVLTRNILLLEPDATEFTLTGLDHTFFTAVIGDISLGNCSASTGSLDCKFLAPAGTTFSELGQGLYVAITIDYFDPPPPATPVTIGLDLP